jgi:DNA polymerase-3 subunit gamma/tau
MSEEISFARYYRPSSLDSYIGNTKVKETVKRVLHKDKKKPQSILLTGNTGCGKTTLARIISSWYMCENPNEDGSPCGKCLTCEYMKEYIMTGNNEMLPDIKEIDSSEKGKNDMVALLEEMEYPAYGGGWKVYIIDESHALSLATSTLMLKPLEEPPEKVLIIFATTDPQKMLDTLKNRCQLQLKITKPNTTELAGLLKRVCLDKGKDYDMQGLRIICSRADFVIRDSLNYLEQVMSSRGSATGVAVSEEFDEISDKIIFDFYNAYINKDYLGYINVLYQIKTSFDFGIFLQSLTNFTTRGIYILNNISVEGLSEAEIKSYLEVFSRFSMEDIAYILSSLKKMSYGDIESNLMSFIYTSNDSKEETPRVSIPVSSTTEESKFRNDNLKALEISKLKEGQASLKSSLEEVGFDDAMALFNLEKISKED